MFFRFVRELPGFRNSILVAINFGGTPTNVMLKNKHSDNLPDTGTVIFKSGTCDNYDIDVNLNNLEIAAQEAVMVQFKPPKGSALFSKTSTIADRCFTSSKVCVNVLGILEVC